MGDSGVGGRDGAKLRIGSLCLPEHRFALRYTKRKAKGYRAGKDDKARPGDSRATNGAGRSSPGPVCFSQVWAYGSGVASAGGAGSHVGIAAIGVPPAAIGSACRRMAVELASPDTITVPSAPT